MSRFFLLHPLAFNLSILPILLILFYLCSVGNWCLMINFYTETRITKSRKDNLVIHFYTETHITKS